MLLAWLYSLISVLIVSLVSLIGVFTISLKQDKLNKIVPLLVSFAVGGLFGDAFIHLLPETFEGLGFGLKTSLLIILGIFLFFVLEKFIRWHHCHDANCGERQKPVGPIVAVGDGFHNFFDGMLIAASYLADIRLVLATTLAVILHEIPQEVGNFGALVHSGFSVRKALFYNFISALTAFLGAFVFLAIGSKISDYVLFFIPITAGGFIYIAGSDLLPELHHEAKMSQ